MPHRNAIGDRDRRELAWRAASGLHAELNRLGLPVKRDVARCRLIPAGSHADKRLGDLVLGQPHRIVI